MMSCVFDPVRHRVHLPILHDHLHPERGLSLCEQALLHPLKQHQRLLDGPVSPRRRRNVMALELFAFLMAHVRMTPEDKRRNESPVRTFPKNALHTLHSPADKFHSEIVELLKVVRGVSDGIRFVACGTQRE